MISKRLGATHLLLGATVCFGLAYTGWGFANRIFNEQTVILDPASQVGYCIAVKLTAAEKKVVAESLMRPADPAQMGRLMPLIISGEATNEKIAASRALRERDELSQRTKEIVSRLANICEYERLKSESVVTPLQLATAWLAHDPGFNAMLADTARNLPDAATRLELANPSYYAQH